MANRILLISLGLMIIGFIVGYALPDGWMSFALYHVGGLGATSFLASVTAAIASKKGHRYWRAFSLALFLPVLLGIIVAYLVPPPMNGDRPAVCGGSVSLVVALIFIVVWAFVKRRPSQTAAA
jgi:hypothetical protein